MSDQPTAEDHARLAEAAGAEGGDAPDFEARIAAALEDLLPDAPLRWEVATRVSDLLQGE